jgi:transcriptional regulator with XRE-family HTH domain
MKENAPRKSHREMVEEWKQEPEFKAAYDELETEFTLLRELLLARQRAGLTQAEVAEKMGTKPPAVTRLETALSDNPLVQKVWNFCHTLRDDGVGYGDYLEQLTYLLFLKLAHEYAQEPYNRDTHIPKGTTGPA